ncbi:hypothetical protein V6Z11_A08G026400 [Gossypium hirsutum]
MREEGRGREGRERGRGSQPGGRSPADRRPLSVAGASHSARWPEKVLGRWSREWVNGGWLNVRGFGVTS